MCEEVLSCEVPRRGETDTRDFGDEWDCLEYPLSGRKEWRREILTLMSRGCC